MSYVSNINEIYINRMLYITNSTLANVNKKNVGDLPMSVTINNDKNTKKGGNNDTRERGRNTERSEQNIQDIRASLTRGFSRGPNGGKIQQYKELAESILKEDPSGDSDTFKIVGAVNATAVCGVLGIARVHEGVGYIYTIYLLNTVSGPLSLGTNDRHGHRQTAPVTLGDIYNRTNYFKHIQADFCQQLGVDSVEEVSGTRLTTAPDNEMAMHSVLHNGIYAINTAIAGYDDNTPVTAESLSGFNLQHLATTSMDEYVGENGELTRADIRVSTTYSEPRSSNWGRHDREVDLEVGNMVLTNATGYVDYGYVGVDRNQRDDIAWVPVVNITSVGTATNVMTIGLQLLAIDSICAFAADDQWTSSLEIPSNNEKLAAMTADATVNGQPLDIVSADDPDWDPSVFLRNFVDEEVKFVLHVDEFGADTWLNAVFRDAATDDEAYNIIVDAADKLTAGRFSEEFNKDCDIAIKLNDRVMLGTMLYNNVKYDIRYLDASSGYMLWPNDQTQYLDWLETFNEDSRLSLEERISMRHSMLKEVSSDLNVVGYATPIMLSIDFLEALRSALAGCGFDPILETQHSGARASNRVRSTLRNSSGMRLSGNRRSYTGGRRSGSLRPNRYSR